MIALTFVRQWGGSDRVVWVDIARANESWRRERGYYLRRGAPNRTADWIVRLGFRRIPMPHVSVDDAGRFNFTDGRHRFGWFRDQGVKAMPVTVATKGDAELAKRRFGSRRRTVRVPASVFEKATQRVAAATAAAAERAKQATADFKLGH
jgi:hypothetical protein